jgi:hypothetical protein
MDNILDEMIRREVQLQRFASFMVREYVNPTAQQISREIGGFLLGYENLNVREKRKLINEIGRYVETNWGKIWVDFNGQLEALKQDEANFMLDLYDDYTPPNEKLISVQRFNTLESIMSVNDRAGRWANFTNDNQTDTVRAVNGIVQGGIRDGQPVDAMVQRLRGTYNRKTKEYSGGVLTGKQVRRAEALVRTGVNHHTNAVRDRFALKNKKVIQKRIFFATLDIVTSTICFSNHLNEYDIEDEQYPRLPLHFNERSVYIFKTRGFNPLNVTRPSKGGATEDGVEVVQMIDARTTAGAWLKSQPRWFVDQSLGKKRADLFLSGGLKLDSMVSLQNMPLNLDQLAQTTAGRRAFNRINDI